MWRRNDEQKPTSSPAEPAPPAPRPPVREAAPAESYEHPSASVETRRAGSRISRGITVQGEILGKDDLIIDGEIRGKVSLDDAVVTVGAAGRVSAEIAAKEIIIEGAVEGQLQAGERVEIRRSGSVAGEVVTHRIMIEEGAVFRGRVDILRPGEARPSPYTPAAAQKAMAVAAGAESSRPASDQNEETVQ